MKKNFFTLLFAMAANVGMMNATGIEVNGIWYLFDNSTKTATVTYGGSNYNNNDNYYYGDITVPSSVSYDGNTYTVTSIGNQAFVGCAGITSIVLPNTITSIGKYAFTGCWDLSSINIPNSVTSIGRGAFGGCISFPEENDIRYADTYLIEALDKEKSSYTIKTGTRWIGDEAFLGFKNLTSFDIPNGIIEIGFQAFQGCSSLASVNIPNSVTTIGSGAFWDCTSLTSIDIPNSVTSIGSHAFTNCIFTSFTIPNSVSNLEADAFSHCKNLISITIPNSITCLEEDLFWDCTNLVSVTIPNSVTDIKKSAFGECTSLNKIFNYGETPANTYSNAFDGVNKSTCKLYVPQNSINLYKNAAVWRDFYYIGAVEDVQAIDEVATDKVQGVKVVRNGKVLIRKGEKTYTMQGQEAE